MRYLICFCVVLTSLNCKDSGHCEVRDRTYRFGRVDSASSSQAAQLASSLFNAHSIAFTDGLFSWNPIGWDGTYEQVNKSVTFRGSKSSAFFELLQSKRDGTSKIAGAPVSMELSSACSELTWKIRGAGGEELKVVFVSVAR
jgi:hypothetical protein